MVFDPTSWWALFTSGNIFQAVLSTWTGVIGAYFYVFILMTGMIMIYLKTQNFGTTVITGTLISGIAFGTAGGTQYLPGEIGLSVFILITLGFTIILYKVFH